MRKKTLIVCLCLALIGCFSVFMVGCGEVTYTIEGTVETLSIKASEVETYDYLKDVVGKKNDNAETVTVAIKTGTLAEQKAGDTFTMVYTLGDQKKETEVKVYGMPTTDAPAAKQIGYGGNVRSNVLVKDSFGEILTLTVEGELATDALGRRKYDVENNITFKTTDAAGNAFSFTQKVTVVDEADLPYNDATVNLTDIKATSGEVDVTDQVPTKVYSYDGTDYTELALGEDYEIVESKTLTFSGAFLQEVYKEGGETTISIIGENGYKDITLTVDNNPTLQYTLVNELLNDEDILHVGDQTGDKTLVTLPDISVPATNFQPYSVKYTLNDAVVDGSTLSLAAGSYTYKIEVTHDGKALAPMSYTFNILEASDYYSRDFAGEQFLKYFRKSDPTFGSPSLPNNKVEWNSTDKTFDITAADVADDNKRAFYLDAGYLAGLRENTDKTVFAITFKSSNLVRVHLSYLNSNESGAWAVGGINTDAFADYTTLQLDFSKAPASALIFILPEGEGTLIVKDIKFYTLAEVSSSDAKLVEKKNAMNVEFDLAGMVNDGSDSPRSFIDLSLAYNAASASTEDVMKAVRYNFGGQIYGSGSWKAHQMFNGGVKIDTVEMSGPRNLFSPSWYGGSDGDNERILWTFCYDTCKALFGANNATGKIGADIVNDANGTTATITMYAKNKDGVRKDFMIVKKAPAINTTDNTYAGFVVFGNGYQISAANATVNNYVAKATTNTNVENLTDATNVDVEFTVKKNSERAHRDADFITVYVGADSNKIEDIYNAPTFAFTSAKTDRNENNAIKSDGKGYFRSSEMKKFYNQNGKEISNGWSEIHHFMDHNSDVNLKFSFRTISDEKSTLTIYLNGSVYMHYYDLPSFNAAGYAGVLYGNYNDDAANVISNFTVTKVATAAASAIADPEDEILNVASSKGAVIELGKYIDFGTYSLSEIKSVTTATAEVNLVTDNAAKSGSVALDTDFELTIGQTKSIALKVTFADDTAVDVTVKFVQGAVYSLKCDVKNASNYGFDAPGKGMSFEIGVEINDPDAVVTYNAYKWVNGPEALGEDLTAAEFKALEFKTSETEGDSKNYMQSYYYTVNITAKFDGTNVETKKGLFETWFGVYYDNNMLTYSLDRSFLDSISSASNIALAAPGNGVSFPINVNLSQDDAIATFNVYKWVNDAAVLIKEDATAAEFAEIKFTTVAAESGSGNYMQSYFFTVNITGKFDGTNVEKKTGLFETWFSVYFAEDAPGYTLVGPVRNANNLGVNEPGKGVSFTPIIDVADPDAVVTFNAYKWINDAAEVMATEVTLEEFSELVFTTVSAESGEGNYLQSYFFKVNITAKFDGTNVETKTGLLETWFGVFYNKDLPKD